MRGRGCRPSFAQPVLLARYGRHGIGLPARLARGGSTHTFQRPVPRPATSESQERGSVCEPFCSHPQQRQELSEIDESLRFPSLLVGQVLTGVLLIEKVVEPLLNGGRQPALLKIARQININRECHDALRVFGIGYGRPYYVNQPATARPGRGSRRDPCPRGRGRAARPATHTACRGCGGHRGPRGRGSAPARRVH